MKNERQKLYNYIPLIIMRGAGVSDVWYVHDTSLNDTLSNKQGFSWTEIHFGQNVRAAPILFGHLEIF